MNVAEMLEQPCGDCGHPRGDHGSGMMAGVCGVGRCRCGRWNPSVEKVAEKRPAADPVNHPDHYKAGGMEAIDVIEAFGLGFHLGNAVKYVLRAGRKSADAKTDLQKARWYIDRAIAAAEQEASS